MAEDKQEESVNDDNYADCWAHTRADGGLKIPFLF